MPPDHNLENPSPLSDDDRGIPTIMDMRATTEYGCEVIEGIADLALMALNSPEWVCKRDMIRQALRVIGERARWTSETVSTTAEIKICMSKAQGVSHA